MSRFSFLTALLAAALVLPSIPAWSGPEIDIEFEKYELPNGLDVILHEDHSIPVVAVNLWYHVGSKNEKPGRTGFAHLFEHMMFQGSQHHDAEYFEPLQRIGGRVNGSTSEDRTNYWENVPANYLELALWLESDRLGYLLPAMTQEKLDNQRSVVKNERRQGMDNQPYGRAEEIILPLLYPSEHPYSWTVIGSMDDLTAASLEDVSEFFRTYYTPNNVSLCIAGDFDPREARSLVERYFGPIPPGPAVDRLEAWIPELEREIRAVAEDDVNLPRLYYVWHTPAFYAPGDAEFDILASILSGGKTSRLYQALVYEQQIAQDVRAYQESRELGSLFHIQVTAKEGHTLEEVERAVDAELARILEDGVTGEELEQAQMVWEAGFVRGLQRIGSFGGVADALNRYNVMLGNPGRFQWDLDRYRNATRKSVLHYARECLDPARRVVLHIVPQGELAAEDSDLDRNVMPGPAAEPTFDPPEIQRATLPNGLELYVVEKRGLPLVQLDLVVRSGWSDDPPDRFGAAALTAALLDEGTEKRTALEISEEAKSLGARLSTHGSFDGSVVSLSVLRRNLTRGLDLMADVALHPTFPPEELERQRSIYLGRIGQEAKQPMASAFKTFQRELYGSRHPYSQPFTGSGTEETIRAISQGDLVEYYRANYYPNNAALIMVGDLSLGEAESLAEKAFREWRRGRVVRREVPPAPRLGRTTICLVEKADAEQSFVMVGHVGLSRGNPDYLAFDVMNHALGGQFSSRINLNLREDKGYTYGARSLNIAVREPGPFAVYAPVETPGTSHSVTEILRELRDVMGPRPLTVEELADSRNNLIKSFPQDFQTVQGIGYALQDIVLYDLPPDEWETYISRVEGIDGGAATRAAAAYLHPEALLIVVVGDLEEIEEDIRALDLGDVIYAQAP